MSLSVIILAAGKGTRMKSSLPKVLHQLAGKSLLGHVLTTAESLSPTNIGIVYGHGGEQLLAAFTDQSHIQWSEQSPQLGTAHAVMQAMNSVAGTETVLILYGDVPLISKSTLSALLRETADGALVILTAELNDPTGYGRIVRDKAGRVTAITEEKDANATVKAIREINSGIMAMPVKALSQWLTRIDNNNAQGEYYLTDIVKLAVIDGTPIRTQQAITAYEIMGVNSRSHLAELERIVQKQSAEYWMGQGVSIKDPARFDIRGDVEIGRDVIIDVDVIFEGRVSIGDGARIGPFCLIRDCKIGKQAVVHSHCHLEQADIGERCQVGPFARLRPETVLQADARVGNFVEVKKSSIGANSKVNHLSYIGDSEIGRDVNIGAGTITCNYDGANKHKTIIEDGVFIGSDTQLVAPVKIGKNTTIGAGSTITKDTPEAGLTLSRARQQHIPDWKRPEKKKDRS